MILVYILTIFYLPLAVLTLIDRNRFKRDLGRKINSKHLHDEVLSQQQVLDFETYKTIMGLINSYTNDLTNDKNNETFE